VGVAAARRSAQRREDADSSDDGDGFAQHSHRVSNLVYHNRNKLKPGQGMYRPPVYLDEWKKATVGRLSGTLLDLGEEVPPPATVDPDQPWWETPPSKRRGSASRPMKAEAFDGEYDESNNGMSILDLSPPSDDSVVPRSSRRASQALDGLTSGDAGALVHGPFPDTGEAPRMPQRPCSV